MPGRQSPDLPLPTPGSWSFAVRVTVVMVVLVLGCGVAVLVIGQRSARQEARRLADRLFEEVSRHAVDQTRAYVGRVAPGLASLQGRAESGLLPLDDDRRLLDVLLADLRASEDVSWISFADTSGRFVGVTRGADGTLGTNVSHIDPAGRTKLTEAAVLPDGSTRITNTNDDSGYDPRQRAFYQAATSARGTMVWLDPYVFYGQNVPGVTCAAAVMIDGEPRGVLTIDFTLAALNRHLAALRASEHSQLYLVSGDGQLIGQQRGGATTTTTTTTTQATTLRTFRDADPRLAELADRRGRGERRFSYEHDGQTLYASTTEFDVAPGQRWMIAVVAPASDFLGGAERSQRMALYACMAALLVTVVLAALLSRRVSRPVAQLKDLMQRIGGGDLDAHAELTGASEFRALSASLNRMVRDLRDGLRLRHSIAVAMEVQKRLLPERPPAVPGLDICGYSRYCDETGGDYYDFLITEPSATGELTVVVGDVMGHGVGAALIMASVRAVLRDRTAEPASLADLLTRLNQIVSRDTRGAQFMTMLLAVIDPRRGTYRFASAGHDPAMIYRAATASFEEIDEGGLPLGVVDDSVYVETAPVPLSEGDVIVIGTDGIWEMKSPAGEEFGKDRLRDLIRRSARLPADEMATALVAAIEAFRGGGSLADDVTFVLVKFLGAPRPAGTSANDRGMTHA